MILRHAIRYMELTNSDFITDLKDFAELQRSFEAGYVPDDFTEKYESFTDKLLILWSNCNGDFMERFNEPMELPSQEELINMFCKVVFVDEKKEAETVFFSSNSILRKKKSDEKNNKTLELLTFLANNEMNIAQYLDMELELIYKVIALVAEKKKEEREKERKRKRRGM